MLEVEDAQEPVLPALDDEARGDEGGRGTPQIDVARVQILLVLGRVAPEQAAGVGRELEDAVAPVGRPVPFAVPGRDEEVARAGLDHDSSAPPDGRSALRARRRIEQALAIAAERVEDVDEPTRA